MRTNKWMFLTLLALLSLPSFATTYWGGFEDGSGSGADHDFNDLVYSISGASLTLHTATGILFNQAWAGPLNTDGGVDGTIGTPFWNNASGDGPGGYNLGWCIYGGGACNVGVGMAPGAQYLATSSGGSVNDVYFSSNGSVGEQVVLSITASSDVLGWELVSGVGGTHVISNGAQGLVTFTPTGDFVLVSPGYGQTFSSDTQSADSISHFAFFLASPEPSTIKLLLLALAVIGPFFRRSSRG